MNKEVIARTTFLIVWLRFHLSKEILNSFYGWHGQIDSVDTESVVLPWPLNNGPGSCAWQAPHWDKHIHIYIFLWYKCKSYNVKSNQYWLYDLRLNWPGFTFSPRWANVPSSLKSSYVKKGTTWTCKFVGRKNAYTWNCHSCNYVELTSSGINNKI